MARVICSRVSPGSHRGIGTLTSQASATSCWEGRPAKIFPGDALGLSGVMYPLRRRQVLIGQAPYCLTNSLFCCMLSQRSFI